MSRPVGTVARCVAKATRDWAPLNAPLTAAVPAV
jgi:hypothetical protein